MKPCPLCAELNFDDAVHCKWCYAPLTEPPPETPILSLPEAESGKATASLICGIFFLFWPLAVAAIILGHIARGEIRRSRGRLRGAGRALAGMILGYSGVAIIPVILIVVAIAIPNLLRERAAISSETVAVRALRTLNMACTTYRMTYGHYPLELKQLGPGDDATAEHAALIDSSLATGRTSGYLFFYRLITKRGSQEIVGYVLNADPLSAAGKGQKHYFTNETGVIHVEIDKPAKAESPELY